MTTTERTIGQISFVLKTVHAIAKKEDKIVQVLEVPLQPGFPSKHTCIDAGPLLALPRPHPRNASDYLKVNGIPHDIAWRSGTTNTEMAKSMRKFTNLKTEHLFSFY